MSSYERDCKFCGKEFKTIREWQKFCCPDHQKKYWRKIYKERYNLTDRVEKLEEQLKASQEQTNKDKEVTGEEVKT